MRAVEPVLEEVGHGDQLDLPAGDREGVAHGAAAASAAADQGQPDRVVLAGVDVRDGHAGQGRGRGHPARARNSSRRVGSLVFGPVMIDVLRVQV